MPPPYYRGCWHGVSRGFLCPYCHLYFLLKNRYSSGLTELYIPKDFIAHAASHCHPFGHCKRFSTAASRRSLGSVSVPVWLTILLDQLPVFALVSHYLTNKLIGHRLLFWCQALLGSPTLILNTLCQGSHSVLAPLSQSYSKPEGRLPMCYSPFCHSPHYSRSFDLHA